ncbi:protein obstructor-E isoform X2 [Coccinella septempunctata]|uniref:protein obstructor-E isoform X2 n=1 Tax=Coccinella septempunctata TaxID=41139 RepID=UPI001D06629C|nr:protein obstructor-E isoform X2 [Coccinella septempunctata]
MNVFVTAALLVLSVVSAQGAVLGSPQCPDPNGVFAYEHPESCNLFFLCTNGTLTVETCENGLLFDGKGNVHHHCNYNWAVDCGTRKADLTPISTPGCEYQFGIYPESHECSTHYIKCAHGEPQANQCEPGLVYDERIHGCNWPDLLLETCNPEGEYLLRDFLKLKMFHFQLLLDSNAQPRCHHIPCQPNSGPIQGLQCLEIATDSSPALTDFLD